MVNPLFLWPFSIVSIVSQLDGYRSPLPSHVVPSRFVHESSGTRRALMAMMAAEQNATTFGASTALVRSDGTGSIGGLRRRNYCTLYIYSYIYYIHIYIYMKNTYIYIYILQREIGRCVFFCIFFCRRIHLRTASWRSKNLGILGFDMILMIPKKTKRRMGWTGWSHQSVY